MTRINHTFPFDLLSERSKQTFLEISECLFPWTSRITGRTTEKQVVTDKERDKFDTPQCEDITDDFFDQQYKFPYEDYRIIGDTSEIDKVIHTCGLINIDVADITSTLSTDTLNYVTVGVGDSIASALKQSVDNLAISTTNVKKMLFQILIPQAHKPDIKTFAEFVSEYDKDIDLCWGLAFDESLADSIKVILITSSK